MYSQVFVIVALFLFGLIFVLSMELTYNCLRSRYDPIYLFKKNKVRRMYFLLQEMNVNTEINGVPLLLLCIKYGSGDMLNLLLSKRPNIWATDRHGRGFEFYINNKYRTLFTNPT